MHKMFLKCSGEKKKFKQLQLLWHEQTPFATDEDYLNTSPRKGAERTLDQFLYLFIYWTNNSQIWYVTDFNHFFNVSLMVLYK